MNEEEESTDPCSWCSYVGAETVEEALCELALFWVDSSQKWQEER